MTFSHDLATSSGKETRYYLAPVMAMHQDRLMISMDPKRFGPHPACRESSAPPLTHAQEHTLRKVAEAAAATELKLSLEPGDILFINNWAVLHRREAYDDDESTSRHLVRLWLRNSDYGWPVPRAMVSLWQRAYGNEGGGRNRLYALHPMPKYHVPKYSMGSAAFPLDDND